MTDSGRTVQPSVTDNEEARDRALIDLVRAFIRELHPQRAATITVTPAFTLCGSRIAARRWMTPASSSF